MGFCLVRLSECGSTGSLDLGKQLRKGGYGFLVFTGMIGFYMSFGACLFGED